MKLTTDNIQKALRSDFYADKEMSAIIAAATQLGYVRRISHTQAEWIESGLNNLQRNEQILADSIEKFNKKEGPRVGDFIEYSIDGNKYAARITHIWPDSVQTDSGRRFGSSFYFAGGRCEYSGGLDSGVQKSDLILTIRERSGAIWFFNQGKICAHNGFYTEAPFRVFELSKGADMSGLFRDK